nr:MAG TPA: hypothetical protein [Caudoviricetes sp.]
MDIHEFSQFSSIYPVCLSKLCCILNPLLRISAFGIPYSVDNSSKIDSSPSDKRNLYCLFFTSPSSLGGLPRLFTCEFTSKY